MQKHNVMKYLILYERKIKQLKNICNSTSGELENITLVELELTKKQINKLEQLIE